MKKKVLSLALALALCLGLTVPAFAAEMKLVEFSVPVVEGYEDYTNSPNKHDYKETNGYYWMMDFSEGLMRLEVFENFDDAEPSVGFVDKTGKVIIPAEYEQAGNFSEGFAWAQKNRKLGFIDKTGKALTPFQYDAAGGFSDGMAIVKKNGKFGFIDTTGKEVIPCAYDDVWAFCQGLAAVKNGGKWGFIDKTGKEVIPFQYDEASGFYQGLTAVKKGGKWGFIDKAGETVVDFQYDNAGSFGNGLAPVMQGSKWGYVDKIGELAIPCTFETAGYFSEGLAPVMQGGKWGYIDTTGKLVVPCKYDMVGSFSGGFAPVGMLYAPDSISCKWGFIDTTGKEIVTPTSHTMDGAEYAINPHAHELSALLTFQDGYASACRHFYNGDWPGGSADYFYYALTVDAKVADWAREQVDSAAVKGLMPDCLGDDFTVNITRAEFAAVAVELYEAMSGDTAPAPGENPFSDTDDPVVLQANALGIVKGSGGKFRPDDLVSRQEAALMLSRVYTELGGEIPTVEATTFADNDKVASWAMDAVAFMSDKKVVNGKGNNSFDPLGNASIQEALIIALRMIENLDVE